MSASCICWLIFAIFVPGILAGDSVRLKDVETLTLYDGRMTTGRRSSPVPQLNCVGGTAGCSFKPKTVQCYNKGFDGSDVQWECKSSMDNSYTFGKIEVLCEGYSYPDDPYILKGSCGLEYTIDSTNNGNKNQGKSYFGNSHGDYFSPSSKKFTSLGDIILLIVAAIIIYALYKTCISTRQYSTTSDDYPADDPYQSGGSFGNAFGGSGYGSAPPPPGFRSDYSNDASCGAGRRSYRGGTGSSGGGGFWTGAMTGGLLGYMFGNRGQNYGGGSSWTSGSRPSGSSWGSGSSGSGSSYSSSGFGGTRRR